MLPEWLGHWIKAYLMPALRIAPFSQLVLGVMKGIYDTLLLLLLGVGFLAGGRMIMDTQYTLPRSTQASTLEWALVANHVARNVDIPREVPLVIWFKESGMRAVNPGNCIGIMGAYDLVRSGEHACFTPGPISKIEVSEQLAIGAVEFKKRCPDITYETQDPALIKKCYFAYNAGTGAAESLDSDQSAYVMNGFDEVHQNMVYSDVELGTVQVTALGAWPTHLAVQSLLVTQLDMEERPLTITLIDVSTRIFDKAYHLFTQPFDRHINSEVRMLLPDGRQANDLSCLGDSHIFGKPYLRPRLNPVTETPVLTQDLHGCSYNLPGMDITSSNSTAVLQAPMSGQVTTFTDRWYNSTIRIENDEWVVWMLHPRSYLIKEGEVERGDAVGVMGAVGFATGPHVHYSIYDKTNETFVDPGKFLPLE